MKVSWGQYFGYRKKPGMIAWMLHRITGIGIVIFLLIHLFTAFSGLEGAESFTAHIDTFKTPIYRIGEILVIIAVVYHGLNGLRIMAIEFFGGTRYHKALFAGVLVITAIVTLIFGYFMFIKYPV